LVAVVSTKGKGQGRNYRLATEEDMEAFRNTEQALQALTQTPYLWAFNLPWVPDELMNQHNPNIVSRRGSGFGEWGELFNLIVPKTFIGKPTEETEETKKYIEEVGMQVAMEYERK